MLVLARHIHPLTLCAYQELPPQCINYGAVVLTLFLDLKFV